jgi:hypothetical protein
MLITLISWVTHFYWLSITANPTIHSISIPIEPPFLVVKSQFCLVKSPFVVG